MACIASMRNCKLLLLLLLAYFSQQDEEYRAFLAMKQVSP